MKRCPQCEAEYDDHVEYCFVDGAELVYVARAVGKTPLPPPPPAPRRSILPLVIVFVFLAIVAVAGLAAVVAMLSSEPSTTAKTPVQPVAPTVVPATPDEPAPILIGVDSEPSGAEVWEGRSKKCEATPCQVEHPEHAPDNRTFVLKLPGYRDATVTMEEVGAPLFATLRKRKGPRPSPKVRPVPDNNAPDIMDER
ncbi:MAG: hypothetical protein KTR31_14400 [Myxococcales bacterium]|nr:hypothetical protein [Myxococcales bacterium]